MKQKKILTFSFIFLSLLAIYIAIEYKKLFKIQYILIHHNPVSNAIRDQILQGTKKNIFSINTNQIKENLKSILKEKDHFEIIKEYPDTLNIFIQEIKKSIMIEIIDSQTKSKTQKFQLKDFNKLHSISLNTKETSNLVVQFYEDKKINLDFWKKILPKINQILKSVYEWNYIFFQQIEKISFFPIATDNFIQLKNYPILFYFEEHLSFQTLVHIFIVHNFLDIKSIKWKEIHIDKNQLMIVK